MSFTVGYGELPAPMLFLGSAADGSEDDAGRGDLGLLPHGQFEINGIRFPVPPQSISIYEENFNHQYQTLRTRESTKVRSGHARINIRVSAVFTGVSVGLDADNGPGNSLGTINRTLMPILYSLKKMPLCFIDNELIRRSLPVMNEEVVLKDGDKSAVFYTGEVIGAFLKSVNISTVPGMPHAINAEFQFAWYNHRPFATRLRFRKNWFESFKDQPSKTWLLKELYGQVNKGQSANNLVKGAKVGEVAEAHVGRSEFITNYGHPSIAFNSTTHFTSTDRIQESRPLLEYLWPYRYKSTNPEYTSGRILEDLRELPPFRLNDFSQELAFQFSLVQPPTVVNTDDGPRNLSDIADDLIGGIESDEAGKRDPAGPQIADTFAKQDPRPKYGDLINAAAAKYGVDPILIAAVIAKESGGYAGAEGTLNIPKDGRPPWKAQGLMQISPDIATRYNVTDRFDPEQNIKGGVQYLKARLDRHDGDLTLALWEYYAGPGELKREQEQLRKAGRPINIPNGIGMKHASAIISSGMYVDRVMARYRAFGGVVGPTGKTVKSLGQRTIEIDAKKAFDILLAEVGPVGPAWQGEWTLEELRQILLSRPVGDTKRNIGEALLRVIDEGARIEVNEITGKVAEIRSIVLRIPEGNPDIIPDSISAGFGTNLVMVPLQGHRFPTVQYIGGQHTAATISFRCERDAGRRFVSEFKLLQNSHEQAAIGFREFVKSAGIRIENSMLNGLGIDRVMIEDVSTDTIPGSPESLSVTIRFIQAALPSAKQQVLVGKAEASIEGIAVDTLGMLFSKGYIVAGLDNAPPSVAEILASRPSAQNNGVGIPIVRGKRMRLWMSPLGQSSVVASRISMVVDELNDKLDALQGDQKVSLEGETLHPLDKYRGFGGKKFNIPPTAAYPQVPKIYLPTLLGTSATPGIVDDPTIRIVLSIAAQKIVGALGTTDASGKVADQDFSTLMAQFGSMLQFTPGHEAYPDLQLPPNPITGLRHDMTPDFFLYNEADVKMSNANLQKILFNDISQMPRGRGFREGLRALESAMGGIRQVYGVDQTASDLDGVVQAAHLGKDGTYMKNHPQFRTTGTKKDSEVLLLREPPELENAIISGGDLQPLSMETNINIRNEGRGDPNGKSYKQAERLKYHFQNSPYKQQFETPPSNLNRIGHIFESEQYKGIFQEFQERYEGNHLAIRRSFPTFKILFVEEEGEISANTDSPLEAKLFRKYALDDFYGANSVSDISIVKNKDMAADLCVVSMLDLDGVLYNRKFLQKDSSFGRRSSQSQERKNPFLNTVIKEGMKMVIKFGYSNDPDALTLVFVGQIAQFQGNQMIEIVGQSYGTELINKRFGTDPNKNVNFWNSTTADILHDLMDREELRHFGRWELADIDILGGIFGHEKLRPDGQTKKVWSWKPSVVDDNLFVPSIETYASRWARFWGDIEFIFFDTTIWEIFKEMELRHPGLIAYPVPYGNGADARMTMFFGHPSMDYLSRPPGDSVELESQFSGNNVNTLDMRNLIIRFGGGRPDQDYAAIQAAYVRGLQILSVANPQRLATARERIVQTDPYAAAFVTDNMIEDLLLMKPQAKKILDSINKTSKEYRGELSRIPESKFWQSTMIFQKGRMRPFRNYELVTSLHDIIDNSIRCDHRETFNSVTLRYTNNDDVDLNEFDRDEGVAELTVNADDNIKEHHIRRTIESWPNCSTDDLARRYASQLMANSLKKTYRGELTIMGKPHLKPYDIVWLYDNYSDMAGPFEVEEVVHSFNSSTGFTTEIVPNMIVVVKEEVTTLMVDAIGAFFTEHLKDFTDGFTFASGTVLSGGLAAGVGRKFVSNVVAPQGIKAKVGAALNESRTAIGAGVGGLGVGASVAAGTESNTGEFIGGAIAGTGAGVAFLVNPIAASIAGVVAGCMLYKILKYNATREPVLITPLIKQGKPFITGVEGMESDGLLITDIFNPSKKDAAMETFVYKKWRYFTDGIGDAIDILDAGLTVWSNR